MSKKKMKMTRHKHTCTNNSGVTESQWWFACTCKLDAASLQCLVIKLLCCSYAPFFHP